MSTEYKIKSLTSQGSPVSDVDVNDAIRSVLDSHEQWTFWQMLAGAGGKPLLCQIALVLLFQRSAGTPISKLGTNRCSETRHAEEKPVDLDGLWLQRRYRFPCWQQLLEWLLAFLK